MILVRFLAFSAIAFAADTGTSSAPAKDPFTATQRKYWAFQPVHRTTPPVLKDAKPENPIDAFIRARLEATSIKPAAQADRVTLLRRVTFDLTGLPPTPQETDSFLADKSPGAYEKVI